MSQCYDSIDSSSSVRQDEEQIRTSQVRDVTTNNKSTRTVKTKLTRKFGGKKYKMKKTNKLKIPKDLKITYHELKPGLMMPQFDLGYKTDAVELVREMRGHY